MSNLITVKSIRRVISSHGRLAVAYRRIRVESHGVPGIWNHPMKEIINVPRLSPVINGPHTTQATKSLVQNSTLG